MSAEDLDLFGTIAPDPSRKVSRTTPNLANRIGDDISRAWPELAQWPGIWVGGSAVWPQLYGERRDLATIKDLDLFATSADDYDGALAWLRSIATEPGVARAQITRSRDTAGRGERIHTSRGWVDIWFDAMQAPGMIGTFPTDGYAHCRAAYNPHSRQVLIQANEAAPVCAHLPIVSGLVVTCVGVPTTVEIVKETTSQRRTLMIGDTLNLHGIAPGEILRVQAVKEAPIEVEAFEWSASDRRSMRRAAESLLARHPLPWAIKDPDEQPLDVVVRAKYQVIASDGHIVMRCPRLEEARAFVYIAEQVEEVDVSYKAREISESGDQW